MLLHNFRSKFHPGSKAWKAISPLTFAIGIIFGYNLYLLTFCMIPMHLLNVQIWNLKRNAKIIFIQCTLNSFVFLALAHNNLLIYAAVMTITLVLRTLILPYRPLNVTLIGYLGILIISSLLMSFIPSLTNTNKLLIGLSLLSLVLLCSFTIKQAFDYINSNRILYSAISLFTLLFYLYSNLNVFFALSMTFVNAFLANLGEVRR